MMPKSRVLIFGIYLIFSVNCFANKISYDAIIDAGSSGSRIYLFQIYDHSPQLPYIKEIYESKVTPGISSFAENPQQAIFSIKELVTRLGPDMHNYNINIHDLSIKLFATAGMRGLSTVQQEAIYDVIKQYFKELGLKSYQAKTISGQDEAIYDWLAVNYLLKRLDNHAPTVGALDLGGASTQISFETHHAPDPKDLVVLKLGNKQYKIFAHSFLGLGLNKSFENTQIAACFPTGYQIKNNVVGHFQQKQCEQNINKYVSPFHIDQIVPSVPAAMQFYAFSGYYYVFDFFRLNYVSVPILLRAVSKKICDMNYQQLGLRFPEIEKEYLNSRCFGGSYVYLLLTHYYQFNAESEKINVVKQIEGMEVSWVIGAELAAV